VDDEFEEEYAHMLKGLRNDVISDIEIDTNDKIALILNNMDEFCEALSYSTGLDSVVLGGSPNDCPKLENH